MINNNFNDFIIHRGLDYSSKETTIGHRTKLIFKTIGLIIGNILTLGILGTVLDLKDQRKIRKLQLGKGDSLVQAQRRKIADLKRKETPYVKKAEDPNNIAGAAKSDRSHRYYAKGMTIDAVGNDKDGIEDYIKNNSAEALFKSAFEHTFEQLIADGNYQLSRNKDIREDEYAAQRSALARLMVLDLIEEAELQSNACGTIDLHLNNNITVYQQCSEKIVRKDDNGYLEATEAFVDQTAFTPSNNGTVKGLIDPCGIKLILAKINEEEKAALKIALARALTDDASQELIDAKALIAANQDLSYAMNMIERITDGIEERYKNAFELFWNYFANEDDGDLPNLKPAEDKEVMLISYPTTSVQKKTNQKALTILKAIGIIFLNISTLHLYSLAKYLINQRKINQLDPATKTQSIACQRKLYAEIDSLEKLKKGEKDNNVTQIDPKQAQRLGPLNEEDELKRYQKREFNWENAVAPIDVDSIEVDIPDAEYDPIGFFQYSWRLSNKKTLENTTMERLLITAFDEIFQLLITKAEDGQIQFSRNENWIYRVDIHTVMTRMIVLDLIKWAQMTCKDDVHTLHLNGDLKVSRSIPEVIAREVNGRRVEEPFYMQSDAWTPLPFKDNPNPVMRGIDPIGIKWILTQLDQEDMNHLERLLLDEYIPDDNADLVATKNYIRRNAGHPKVKLIKQAVHLIKEVAKSLDTRYGSLLKTLWKKNANQDEGDNGALPPEKAPEVEAPPPAVDAIVPWEPAVDLPLGLQPIFNRMKANVEGLWSNMNRNILSNPKHPTQENISYNLSNDHFGAEAEIKDQFNLTHWMVGGGCFYGAITSLITQDNTGNTDENAAMIKRAMANYLNEHKHEYRNAIQQELNMSVDDLIDFLRGGRRGLHYSFTNVEAEIFAHTFGIKVQLLCPGCSIKVSDGLMQSEGFSVGPNTKESLYLWNTGYSWYAAMPKLRQPAADVPANQARAIRNLRIFWQPNGYGY